LGGNFSDNRADSSTVGIWRNRRGVRDLARDPRFANNPWLKERGLRFYAGVPLRGPNGFPVGSLCILDTKPRDMSPQEQDLLKMIAADVMEQIKRRRVTDTPDTLESEKK